MRYDSNDLFDSKDDTMTRSNLIKLPYVDRSKIEHKKYEKDDWYVKEIKEHIDRRFSEHFPSSKVEAHHVGGLKSIQQKRLISTIIASFICGTITVIFLISLFGLIKVPTLFLLSIFFPSAGVAISCSLALNKGSSYDRKKEF